MGQYDRKRVRLSPTGDSLTQQHFTFHDGEKKDYSSQSSYVVYKKRVCFEHPLPLLKNQYVINTLFHPLQYPESAMLPDVPCLPDKPVL